MMPGNPFAPLIGGSVLVNVAATTAAVAIPGGARVESTETVRLYNAGPAAVAIEFGDSAGVTAVADGTDMVIPAGNTEVFTLLGSWTHMATIGILGGTAALYVTRGRGS